MKFYNEDLEKVLKEINSTVEGISNAEAEKRLAENGKNKLDEGEKVSIITRFLQQLKDPMLIILMIAAAVSGVTAIYHFSSSDYKCYFRCLSRKQG